MKNNTKVYSLKGGEISFDCGKKGKISYALEPVAYRNLVGWVAVGPKAIKIQTSIHRKAVDEWGAYYRTQFESDEIAGGFPDQHSAAQCAMMYIACFGGQFVPQEVRDD